MKKLVKVVLCLVLIAGLAYTPVVIPQLSNTNAVAVAEAATIKISTKNVKLYKNGTYQLKVNGTNKTVKWSSSKPGVATVKKGLVTAKKIGKTVITAKVGGKTYKCNVTVCYAPKMNCSTASLQIGGKKTLKVSNAIRTVKWSSSNPKVATVNKGVVTGKSPGTAIITAKVGNKKTTCKITVKKRMSVNKTVVNFDGVSGKKTVKVTFNAPGKWNVYWETPDVSIVTAEWSGVWNGNTTELYIYPEGGGSSYIDLTNSYNKQKIRIKVNVKSKQISAKMRVTREGRFDNGYADFYIENTSSEPIEIAGVAHMPSGYCYLDCDMNKTFILEPGYHVTLRYYRAMTWQYRFEDRYYDMYLDEDSRGGVNYRKPGTDGWGGTIWCDADNVADKNIIPW